MLSYGKLRIASAVLAFIVGWLGSLHLATLAGWEPMSLGVANVTSTCPDSPATGGPVDADCMEGDVLYEVVGTPWPPFKTYALAAGALLSTLVMITTRRGKRDDLAPSSHDSDRSTYTG